MKTIINGKKYDTDTATVLVSTRTLPNWNPSDVYYTQLYRKATGEYFLVKASTGTTKVDIFTIGGGGATHENEQAAREWVETGVSAENISVELYEEIFGTCEE